MFKNWNPFEKLWLAFFTLFAPVLVIVQGHTFVNIVIVVTGILCVVLAARGDIWTYVWGMPNTILYAIVAYNNNLFGEAGLYVFFFLPMNVIGFLMWRRKLHDKIVEMRGMRLWQQLGLFLSVAGLILLTGAVLATIKGQKIPYIDATTNVLSVVATFLMILRFKEQWLLYIVLNVFSLLMWFIRYIDGSKDGIMMMLMWVAFLVNAVYGYYNWSKGAKRPVGTAADG